MKLHINKTFVFFLVMLSATLSFEAYAGQISIINKLVPPKTGQNIILQADKAKIKGSDSNWNGQVIVSSADHIYIDQDLFSVTPLYQWDSSKVYSWANVGYKIYLANDDGTIGPYLGYLNFTLHANANDKAGALSDVQYSSSGADPKYQFQKQPSIEYIQQSNASYIITGNLSVAADVTPPIITNSGWTSGMGNKSSTFEIDQNFWVQDYGMDEPGRWTVEDNAIAQSTKNIGSNYGSRAYPVIKDSSGNYKAGVGVAYTGIWQIDIKIGSNGAGDFCETFYLAERRNLAPGPGNYIDGAPNKSSNIYGREIDIMETKWSPSGPATNLPEGGETSWNPSGVLNYGLGQMEKWSNVGGAPTPNFITFGAYITGDELNANSVLWLYAYKPGDSANDLPTLWYTAGPIPLLSHYVQKGPFAPYIGTWGKGNNLFSTKYKNFVYLPANAVGNVVPSMDDKGKAFADAVQKATFFQKLDTLLN